MHYYVERLEEVDSHQQGPFTEGCAMKRDCGRITAIIALLISGQLLLGGWAEPAETLELPTGVLTSTVQLGSQRATARLQIVRLNGRPLLHGRYWGTFGYPPRTVIVAMSVLI